MHIGKVMVDLSANPAPQTTDCCLGPKATEGSLKPSATVTPTLGPGALPNVPLQADTVERDSPAPLPTDLPPLSPQPLLYFR